MPHIDRSTEDILEVATEALFNRKRTMGELLAHAEKVYRRKLKTPEDCDDMLGIINNEAEKFNECIRAFQKTKKRYEKGEDGAKIINTEEKAAIALLKKNCQKLESSLGDFVQGNHITGKELEDFKAYIVGLRKIVKKIKKERAEIAKEGLSYDDIYELIYAPEGADSEDDDDDKKSKKKSDDDDEDSEDDDEDDKKSKKKKKDSTDDSEEDFDGESLEDEDDDDKKSKKKKSKDDDDDDSEDDDEDEDEDDDEDDKKSKKKSKDDDDDGEDSDDDKDSGDDWPDFSLGGDDDDDDKKSKKKSKDSEDDDEDEDEDSEDDDKKDKKKKKKKKKDDEEEEVEESFNHSDKDMDIAFEMARDLDMSFSEALDVIEEGYEEDFMAENQNDSERYELAEFLRDNLGYTIENAMDFAFDLTGDGDDEFIVPPID